MRKVYSLIIIVFILLTSCRRVFYSEYRNKDYYLINGGKHYFFDSKKTFDKPVLREIYKSSIYDTCSCISVLNKTSEVENFNQLLLGIRFNLKVYSRSWYSGFPNDGSIESIENINVYIARKNEIFDVSQYLSNHMMVRDNIILTNVDSSSFEFDKGIYFNYKEKCLKGYAVNDLNDLREKFNMKKFDDGSNTVDWYTFLFSISPDCPHKIKDFDKIITVLTLKTKHTKRTVKFDTALRKNSH